jgi:hypothetical protein
VKCLKKHPAGAKALLILWALLARLKPCPCYKTGQNRVFPQPAKADSRDELLMAQLKPRPFKTSAPMGFSIASKADSRDELLMAQLEPRPFKTSAPMGFPLPVKPCSDAEGLNIESFRSL